MIFAGKLWRQDRKEINPAFSSKLIRENVSIYEQNIEDLLNNFRKAMNVPTDVIKFLSLYTMESAIGM